MEVGEERLVPRCAGVETESSKILNRRIRQEGGRGQICHLCGGSEVTAQPRRSGDDRFGGGISDL